MQQIVSRFGKVAGNALAKVRRAASDVLHAAHVLEHAPLSFEHFILGHLPDGKAAAHAALHHAHPGFTGFMTDHPLISRFLTDHPKTAHAVFHATHRVPGVHHYLDHYVPLAPHIASAYNSRTRMAPRAPKPRR